MKINVEFESFEELVKFSENILGMNIKIGEETKKPAKTPEAPAPKPEPAKPAEPESTPDPKAEPVPTQEPESKPEVTYTLTDVRAALAALAKKDKEKMKAVLNSVGATNLKEVKEEDYATIMERCGDA